MVKSIVHTSTYIVRSVHVIIIILFTIPTAASQTDIKEENMSPANLVGKELISPREKASTESKLVQQRLLYEEQLKEFKSSDRTSICFSNTLSSSSRKLIHEVSGIFQCLFMSFGQLSEQLGLVHVSHAEGKERYVAVSKEDSSSLITSNTSTSDSTISKATSTTGTTAANGVTTTGTTGTTGTTAANGVTTTVPHQQREEASRGQCVPAGMWHCTICGFTLPEINKELHQLRCEREKRRLEDIFKKGTGAERKIKDTQKKKNSKPTLSTTDLDSLLEEMKQNDTICNFSSCKRKVNHLEIVCPFCHRKYCMNHNMAEIHGCEENARRAARQQLEKQLRGERVGTKTDPTKRAHLQRKLDKTINDLSSGRQRKKPLS